MKNKSLNIFVTTLSLFVCSCSTTTISPKKDIPIGDRDSVLDEKVQKYEPESEQAASSIAQEPVTQRKKIILLLGPGYLYAYAHVGALLALEEAHIVPDAIIGIESGAFVGFLYNKFGSVNRMQWALERFQEKDWVEVSPLAPQQSLLAYAPTQRAQNLVDKIDSVIKGVENKSKTDVFTILFNNSTKKHELVPLTGTPEVIESLSRENILERKNLSVQKFVLKLTEMNNVPALISDRFDPNESQIIYVDLLKNPEIITQFGGGNWIQKQLSGEMLNVSKDLKALNNSVSWTVEPGLEKISPTDFKKRAEMIYFGKLAMKNVINKMKESK